MNDAKFCFIHEHGKKRGKDLLPSVAEHLFEVINSIDVMLRTLMRRCTYLWYVEARLADRTSLCPLEVLNNMQEEAVRDDEIVFNGLPSTEPF
ncbi:hypothetical protein Bca52824_070784 [Brassica carinata]|uniref:Uncharacterized protein n=1 Tax=Brassica carinata TaxID=52824 RepID=A0A8X7Q560_BRACI|nr:hypothetical protein Bca52824_070784 [Brassica carinata]